MLRRVVPRGAVSRLARSWRWSAAVLGPLLAFGFAEATSLQGKPGAVAVFVVAVACAAYTGGTYAGLVSTALSYGLLSYFLLEPMHSFGVRDAASVVPIFFAACLGVGYLMARLKAVRQHEAAARAEAENLLRVVDAGSAADTLDELLPGVLRALQESCGADRAVLFLREPSGGLAVRAAVGLDEEEAARVRIPWGVGIAGRIAGSGGTRVIGDVSAEAPVSAYLREGGSLVALALEADDAVIGVLEVSSRRRDAFSERQVGLLKLAAERLSIAIERVSLSDHHRDIAVTLQQSVLPKALPSVAGLEIAARYLPAVAGTEVGGDWYDAFEAGRGRVAIAVGDVVGKGILAASMMAQLRNALRVYALEGLKPSTTLRRLNALAGGSEPVFATLLFGTIDPSTLLLRYASAGHLPLLLIGPEGEARYVECPKGPPLGALDDCDFPQSNLQLEDGSTLILYSDGLVERRRRSIDDGLAALAEAAVRAPVGVESLVEHVTAELGGPEPYADDVAILAVRVRAR